MTTFLYSLPLPNNGDRYDLSSEELNKIVYEAYQKGYERGALDNATITVSNMDPYKDEQITKSITINN